MSPRINGTSSRLLRPRPVDSPWPRLLPALLSSTTSIAASTLETGIHTRTLPSSSILWSRSTMVSLLMPSTLLTWMLPRLLETLLLRFPSTPPVSVLDVTLMDLDFPPESPRTSVLPLRSWCLQPFPSWPVILLEPITLSPAWMRLSVRSLLMTTSSSCLETATWLLPVWSVTGLRVVESSTMRPRPSFCGSMRRIRPELSLCKLEVMSRVSLSV